MKFINIFSTFCVSTILIHTAAFADTTPTQVTFQGEVTSQTCRATINGQSNAVVILPTVTTTELKAKGDTTGLTPFTISLSGCAAPADNSSVKISTRFFGQNFSTEGNLTNISKAKNAATKVALQLTDNADGLTPVKLTGNTAVEGLVLAAGQTSATHSFGIRYIAEETGVSAGPVTATTEYILSYP